MGPRSFAAAGLWLAGAAAADEPKGPPPGEGDFTIKDFHFASGESLPQLRLHYELLTGSAR